MAVERKDGTIVESGERTTTQQAWPLSYDAEALGRLFVGPRSTDQKEPSHWRLNWQISRDSPSTPYGSSRTGLRPAALDELGLVGALREEGSRFGPTKVVIQAPESMPALPSSVEIAAYRIAAEALTNVVRHSDAKLASVQLTTDDGTLEMIITDDGRPTAPWSPGLGLASIKTRASEVGGVCEAGPTAADGGRVIAVLPLEAGR